MELKSNKAERLARSIASARAHLEALKAALSLPAARGYRRHGGAVAPHVRDRLRAKHAAIDDLLDWGDIQDAIAERAKDAEYGRFKITNAAVIDRGARR